MGPKGGEKLFSKEIGKAQLTKLQFDMGKGESFPGGFYFRTRVFVFLKKAGGQHSPPLDLCSENPSPVLRRFRLPHL